MKYLLDTNIVSALVRDPFGRIRMRILERGTEQVGISIVVAAELRFGALLRNSPVLARRHDELFGQLPVIPFEPPSDRHYAELRVSLERRGVTIGANDMLIAAHALALDCTLVTANTREFARVEGLTIENWLR